MSQQLDLPSTMDPLIAQRIHDLSVMLLMSIGQKGTIDIEGQKSIGAKEQTYLLQIIQVLNDNFPEKKSERDLAAIINQMGCHARFEGNVIPITKQRRTSTRTVRKMTNLLRALGFPVISYTAKGGETEDPVGGSRRYGYRWAKDKQDEIEQLRRLWSETIEYCRTKTKTTNHLVKAGCKIHSYSDFPSGNPWEGVQRELQRAHDAGNPYE